MTVRELQAALASLVATYPEAADATLTVHDVIEQGEFEIVELFRNAGVITLEVEPTA